MSSTTPQERDRLIWDIRDILTRVDPEDLTDPELSAAIAIFRLADTRLAGKPTLRLAERRTNET